MQAIFSIKIFFAPVFGISSSFGVPAKERTKFRGGFTFAL
jgi:hypothetical protein